MSTSLATELQAVLIFQAVTAPKVEREWCLQVCDVATKPRLLWISFHLELITCIIATYTCMCRWSNITS